MGKQDIVVDGIDPRTRVAQVLVEADYRMKLVGMGLEPGVLGVRSYLDFGASAARRGPAAAGRAAVVVHFERPGHSRQRRPRRFRAAGHGVRVQSENELLSALGQRVHTGKSEPLNQQFAQSFHRALWREYGTGRSRGAKHQHPALGNVGVIR